TDLQLAAELGKTLLERNKELELALKQQQLTIDEQVQEIEYLSKQTTALKEVNDSRLRIYEQLEVSIQDLERANHRLVLENAAEKKHIKSLNGTIESLESKCEELQSTVDDLNLQIDILKRKSQRAAEQRYSTGSTRESITLRRVNSTSSSVPKPRKTAETVVQTDNSISGTTDEADNCSIDSVWENDGMEQQLLAQLSKMRAQCNRDERKIAELEEQLAVIIQQNQALENQVVQLSHKGDHNTMKSWHEELSAVEEVRQGQLCSRCLRNLDQPSSPGADEDDTTMMDTLNATTATSTGADDDQRDDFHTSFHMDVQAYPNTPTTTPVSKSNPYKQLVEKYEALVEEHRKPKPSCRSLQEEMQMSGEFTAVGGKDTDEESGHGDCQKQSRKTFSTPTDFSEVETTSSGFADETSNKQTQTECNSGGRVGNFLCTIADGDDCKFSIYDDASPIDSRFRERPEYRDLFKEIFKVLKKAAESKEEGEQLPLLTEEDTAKVAASLVAKARENVAGLQQHVAAVVNEQNEPIPEPHDSSNDSGAMVLPPAGQRSKEERALRPLVRQPLEYISVEVRKRSSSRRKNRLSTERSDSPVTHIIGRRRRREHSREQQRTGSSSAEQSPLAASMGVRLGQPGDEMAGAWNGNTLQFWSSQALRQNAPSPTPSQGSTAKYEFKPSSATHDLHKLRKLDLSYAEVSTLEKYKISEKSLIF
ncbi:unnamed protein product, partial [Acanthoscelides obtectus]